MLQNVLLLYKGRVYFGPNSSFKTMVLNHVNNSPLAGHFSYLKSLHKAKQDFYRKGMKIKLKMHIKECKVYQC